MFCQTKWPVTVSQHKVKARSAGYLPPSWNDCKLCKARGNLRLVGHYAVSCAVRKIGMLLLYQLSAVVSLARMMPAFWVSKSQQVQGEATVNRTPFAGLAGRRKFTWEQAAGTVQNTRSSPAQRVHLILAGRRVLECVSPCKTNSCGLRTSSFQMQPGEYRRSRIHTIAPATRDNEWACCYHDKKKPNTPHTSTRFVTKLIYTYSARYILVSILARCVRS